MITKGIFLVNEDAIDKAARLGYEAPEEEYVKLDLGFDINSVEAFFVNCNNDIIIFLRSSGRFRIAYTANTFNRLQEHFA